MNPSASAILPVPVHDDDRSEAFAWLVAEQQISLKMYLHKRLRNEADVEDALQETLVRVYSYQARHTVESPYALLYHVAERVTVDFSRRAQARCADAHCELDDTNLQSAEPSPEQVATAEQDLAEMIDALESLSPKCQNVFMLSRMEGMSYPQIAARCGISVKMVEKYMSRALAELRSRVGGSRPAAP